MSDRVITSSEQAIAVALTGASGIQYGLRLIDCLLAAQRRVYLMVSQAAQVVVNMETELRLPSRPDEIQTYLSAHFGAADGQLEVFGRQQWTAPVASGSNPPEAVVICPCTTGTLASVANGTTLKRSPGLRAPPTGPSARPSSGPAAGPPKRYRSPPCISTSPTR